MSSSLFLRNFLFKKIIDVDFVVNESRESVAWSIPGRYYLKLGNNWKKDIDLKYEWGWLGNVGVGLYSKKRLKVRVHDSFVIFLTALDNMQLIYMQYWYVKTFKRKTFFQHVKVRPLS